MIGLASGTPFAANGAPRKIRPASRTSRTVRAGSRNRSCQTWTNLRRSSTTTEWRRDQCAGMGAFTRLQNLRNDSEGVVGLLIVASFLLFRQFDLRARQPARDAFLWDGSAMDRPGPR